MISAFFNPLFLISIDKTSADPIFNCAGMDTLPKIGLPVFMDASKGKTYNLFSTQSRVTLLDASC